MAMITDRLFQMMADAAEITRIRLKTPFNPVDDNEVITKGWAEANFGNVDAYTKSESDGKYAIKGSSYTRAEADTRFAPIGGGGPGVTIHSGLSGLSADDHQQYLNNARGDARYYGKALTYTKTEVDAKIATAAPSGPAHLHGSGIPADTLGNDGDIYMRTT